MNRPKKLFPALIAAFAFAAALPAAERLELPLNTWVKLSPLTNGPPSPRLGYEGACAWDGSRLIRHAGHNQGGGGEQHSETWSFDPLTAKWTLHEVNTYPPGLCCGQQNVFDPVQRRYIRFPSFSGSHGWQWWREIYLNDSSAWVFDLTENLWRNRRPVPTTTPRPLRAAAWDAHHGVVVIFGGETSNEGTIVYDPWANSWTRMSPKPQPEFRSGGNLTYDAARRRHLLFGSQFSNDAHTWAYDLRANTWTDLKPPSLPPTDKNDAVLAYDPFSRRALALVRISEGKEENAKAHLESWLFDLAANAWTKLNPPNEPTTSGSRARNLNFAPELNAFLLENRTHPPSGPAEQQILALRLSNPAPASLLEPPRNIAVTTDDTGAATLTWETPPNPNAASWAIYRGSGETPWKAEMKKVATVPAKELRWRDTGLERKAVHYYAIHAADAQGHEGDSPALARTQPRVVEDVVVSVLGKTEVALAWKPSPEKDVVGYIVERAPVEVFTEDQLRRLKTQTEPLAEPSVGAISKIGDFTRLSSAPVRGTNFTDRELDFAKPVKIEGTPQFDRNLHRDHLDLTGRSYRFAVFAYRVRAVNALGALGGASAATLTIPGSPQWLFAREAGAACELKWKPNPEKSLAGYRVYRMNGRYDKDGIPRLTTDPIRETTFRDDAAGKPTRRFYVVAVDAIGQEGFPSAPVWFSREYQSFYKPFTTDWHQ